MTFHKTNHSRRSFRHRGAFRLAHTGIALIALLGALATLALADPQAAVAEPEPSPAAPSLTITSPANNQLIPGTVTVTGTKDAASTVRIPSLTASGPSCAIPSGTTVWSCDLALASGSWDIAVVEEFGTDTSLTQEVHVAVRVLLAPTVNGSSPILTTGVIIGTGFAGSGILLSGDITGSCGVVQANGFWSCSVPVTASGDYSLIVRQTWQQNANEPGAAAPGVVVRVDKDAPALPVFTQPSAGAQIQTQPTTFAGTGENGGRVEVFVDSVLLCSSAVTAGQWSCTATVAAGQHRAQGIQWDAAGNSSGVSPGIPFSVPSPATTPNTPGTPTSPQPGSPAPPAPTPSPSPTPVPNAPPRPAPGLPFFPPPVGGVSGLPPLDTWGTPTDYGAAIPSLKSTANALAWLWGFLLALSLVLLVALPLRLLLGVMGPRVFWRRARVAQRNRARDDDDAPLLNPWVTAAIALGAAVLLAALAGGIQAEARYLRLVIAIGIALLVLNGVTVALIARLGASLVGGSTRIALIPLFLVLAALTAFVSRWGGIQPPVIVGVIIAVTFGAEFSRRSRGLICLLQLTATAATGVAAWVGHSALGPVVGFAPSLLSETLGALCIAALGSAVVLLLPVSRMPGRLIFEWSPVAWLVLALGIGTVASVVIAGGASSALPWALGIASAFAAISIASWSWIRFIEPLLASHTPVD